VQLAISAGNAPINEDDVLPVGPTHGVVQGLVTKGKMYVAEKAWNTTGSIYSNKNQEGTNYIYYGQ
jgi:hypothetical protein